MTDFYAVIGNPIHQSKSPLIHGMFAQATGQDMHYSAIEGPLDGFAGAVDAFRAAGGLGLNITTPFKLDAFAYATECSERAQLAGAANAMKFDGDRVLAENFDGIGLVRDVVHNLNCPLKARRVLLLGAGGASAGVLGPLIEAGPAEVVVANRSADKAEVLVQRHAAYARDHGVRLSARTLQDPGVGYDVFVNGTAASLSGSGVPVGPQVLRRGALALDMMYGPAAQAFLDWARQHGAVPRDGLGMLVEQAAESFFVWRGVRPDTRPVLCELRAMVDAPTPSA